MEVQQKVSEEKDTGQEDTGGVSRKESEQKIRKEVTRTDTDTEVGGVERRYERELE